MTPHEPDHDDDDVYDYDHDEATCPDCAPECVCHGPSGPWLMLAATWGFLALVGVLIALGVVGFDSGWALAAGVVVALGVNQLTKRMWVNAAALLGAIVAFDWVAAEHLVASFTAGVLAVPFVYVGNLAIFLAITSARLLRDRRGGRDVVAEEAADGVGKLEQFLARERADVLGGEPGRKIIGMSGYAGSGKDTAAAELMFSADLDYTRVSFADKLREFALAVDDEVVIRPGDPHYEVFAVEDGRPAIVLLSDVLATLAGDWTEAKLIPAIRRRLQRIGTDAGRNVLGENVWVDAVMADLPDGPIVFTDTRFPNEAQAVTDAGGYVVRVTRPGVDAVNAHVSETALDDWDFDAHLYNDGSAAELREQMRRTEDLLFDPDLAPASAPASVPD